MSVFSPPTAEFLRTRGRVATLGMFIIDHFEVRDEDGHAVPLDEEAASPNIGGGGIFAMTAARQFLPPTHCAGIVDQGEDFPQRFKDELASFGSDMIWFRPRNGKTTRALNVYSGTKIGEGHQSFRYLSPQLHLTPKDLVLPPSPFARPLRPEWIHIVCITDRARGIAEELETFRSGGGPDGLGSGWDAKLVWEPLGRSCHPQDLAEILDIIPHFAVFSPNLLEMQSILSMEPGSTPGHAEKAARKFMQLIKDHHPGHNTTAVIIRAGALGSYTLSATWTGWVPAYWNTHSQDQVVDVTGGGNAWMGGFCAGMLLSGGDIRVASIYGSAAASFAIQQKGLPRLSMVNGQESWNGDNPWTRVAELVKRVDDAELSQSRTRSTARG